MGAGLKKDLRVSRVRPGGSLNAFFFLLIRVISQRFSMVRKKGEQAHLESAVQQIVNILFPRKANSIGILSLTDAIESDVVGLTGLGGRE
ncbi:hypothetical protein Lal_00018737, partial [Lupinus albus]